ncbi:MAG: hypothetical protein HYZ50_18115 [Deltaproteobacteria bacterium]|nr:hypothetical protein [Deltaproteobacteria bacterium]
MANSKDQIRQQLENSVKRSKELLKSLMEKNNIIEFGAQYQNWYTRTLPLVKALAPDRFVEFRAYYEADPKRKSIEPTTYVLRDYVNGIAPAPDWRGEVAFDHHHAVVFSLLNQARILASLSSRIETVLSNVEGHLLAEIEDRELAAAMGLAKSNLRAAGTLAGVVLERHLGQVTANRSIKISKKDPTIGDLNEMLKKEGTYELPTYRKIQYLADIRNICCHNKGREPSPEEVKELLSGVAAIIKTVF